MLNKVCSKISQNKNLLMLLSAGIYILALFATLSGCLVFVSILFTALIVLLLLKNCFPLKYLLVWTFLFYLGIANLSIRLKDRDELLNLAPVNSEITGTIVSIPQVISENKIRFFFEVEKISFGSYEKKLDIEKTLVTLNSDKFKDGLKLYNSGTLTGRLSIPFKAGNPSQFDYGNYLRNHHANTVFYAKDFVKLEKEMPIKSKIFQGINNYRENVLNIHSKYLKTPNLEILGGIVFGDDAVSTPKDIKQSFVSSGLLHILAASGMNVAFIYGFFFWLLNLFKVNYKANVLFGMLMVIVYTLMTGLGASVIRASIMLLFVLFGKLIDRDAHSISLLSFVALLMLIFNPLFINDVGFQLSFIVTFGILIMSPALIKSNNKIINYLIGVVSIPIIAQLWVIPIQIFYFNNISIYSIFANIMSVPVLMIISFGGFISSLLAGIQPIADFVCMTFDFVLNILLSILVNISDFCGHLPKSMIQTTHPAIYQLILYYGMLLTLTGMLYKELRERFIKFLIIFFTTFLFLWIVSLIPIRNSDLEIMTFDVGNADCFLIKTPTNEYIMIDTGKSGYSGGKSQAEYIVLRYLKDRGIKNINTLIVTHFDNDHCGGAVDILSEIKVDKLYLNDLNHDSSSAKAIYKEAKENGINVFLAQNLQNVYDKASLKLTNFVGKNLDNDNDNSIVTLLEYNDFKMLFTGDISAESMNTIISNLPKDITVLKVAHHGAVGSVNVDMLKQLNPKYSIISVGENKFGHPSLYTLTLLKTTKILRTDIDNAILIKVKDSKIKILTYDLKKKKWKSL